MQSFQSVKTGIIDTLQVTVVHLNSFDRCRVGFLFCFATSAKKKRSQGKSFFHTVESGDFRARLFDVSLGHLSTIVFSLGSCVGCFVFF